jgi:hypothetical protein
MTRQICLSPKLKQIEGSVKIILDIDHVLSREDAALLEKAA